MRRVVAPAPMPPIPAKGEAEVERERKAWRDEARSDARTWLAERGLHRRAGESRGEHVARLAAFAREQAAQKEGSQEWARRLLRRHTAGELVPGAALELVKQVLRLSELPERGSTRLHGGRSPAKPGGFDVVEF